MTPRSYVYLVIAGLLGLLLWRGGVALYDAGVMNERGVWLEAQAKADREAREKEQADTRTGDAIADDTRSSAGQDVRDTRAETATTIETIRYVYRNQPAPACPAPAVPDGVQDALNRAYDAAAAAAR